MTLEELKQVYKKFKQHDCNTGIVVQMPTPKFKGNYPEKVRTSFGLTKYYPSTDGKSILLYPTFKQVEKLIKKLEGDET